LDWTYRDDWRPPGSAVVPWFLPAGLGSGHGWERLLAYRTGKLRYVRERLQRLDRPRALRLLVTTICSGASTPIERFERLVVFIQRMMIHPLGEQPMEEDAVGIFRRDAAPRLDAEPYPEDLCTDWLRACDGESRAAGRRLGVWCNPFAVPMTGDWGMAGMVHDALELLSLHEGRCGHQACVVVQLALAAGMRARLVQLRNHRVAEVLVDDRWRLADPDALALGFIPRDDRGAPVSVAWCGEHPEAVGQFPVRPEIAPLMPPYPSVFT
jgi:hypothetical protein